MHTGLPEHSSRRDARRLPIPRITALFVAFSIAATAPAGVSDALPARAKEAMRRAATFYYNQIATHGGYVYFYSLDLEQRWGEGRATEDQIWVQPPGTPTVGMAYLEAYAATGERFYLKAATDSAKALIYGQLRSGGWRPSIDFDPRGARTAEYRNGRGSGMNFSSLDDGQTQSALLLLLRVDRAHEFEQAEVHEAVRVGLDALLASQFPNGGFPQGWDGPVEDRPIVPARFPHDDWRTTDRIKNYWDMYTLNDNVCGYVADVLIEAHETYDDPRYIRALRKLGDFLLLAQLPDPQPAWAQQYDARMRPIWARPFEPPAIASDESQEAIATLLRIAEVTGDDRYLEPIPRALAYLKKSLLPGGLLARFYELETNRPLYMVRRGGGYKPIYSDKHLPEHYAWKIKPRLKTLERRYRRVKRGDRSKPTTVRDSTVRRIIDELDKRGRWVSTYAGDRLVGQPNLQRGAKYIASDRFSRNLTLLSRFVAQADQ